MAQKCRFSQVDAIRCGQRQTLFVVFEVCFRSSVCPEPAVANLHRRFLSVQNIAVLCCVVLCCFSAAIPAERHKHYLNHLVDTDSAAVEQLQVGP